MKKAILNLCYAVIAYLKPQEEETIDKSLTYQSRPSTNPTGFKGVTKRGNKYQASIVISNKDKKINIYLGMFDTPEEASAERNKYIDNLK